jgi:hypothetical protein
MYDVEWLLKKDLFLIGAITKSYRSASLERATMKASFLGWSTESLIEGAVLASATLLHQTNPVQHWQRI